LRQDDHRSDVFTYTAKDIQGATATATLTFNITGQNDAPVAVADTASITEDALPNTVNGNVLTNDTDVDSTDNHTVSAVTIGETNGTDNGTTITAVGTYGTLVITKATGGYTYTLGSGAQGLAQGEQKSDVFTYTNSDGHGGLSQSTLTVTVTGVNDAPSITSPPATVRVSEEGLSNGVADTLPSELDTTNNTSASGTITASDADTGDTLTMTFGTPASLTSGGVPITWTPQNSNHMLVGTAGATTIITATITNAGDYNVTLSGPIDHSDNTQEDNKTFSIPVNVSDGHTTTSTTLSVTVEDDSPKAEAVALSVDTASDTNVMVILDVSGSMSGDSGVSGHPTRLEAAIAAIEELLDQYDSLGDVMVRIVTFSGSAAAVGSAWMSVAEAEDALADLTASGNTNYDDALLTAMTAFTANGKLTGSGTQNVSYFLSDGEPTANIDWPEVPGALSENGIQPDEQNYWESFLTSNDIVSYALGISNPAPSTTALDPIAFNGASNTELSSIVVTDLNQLADTLVSTVSSASGSLLSGANSFGADGGYVKSITVDGVTYTFDPAANGGAGEIKIGDDPYNGYNATTKILTVETDDGSELAVVMTTGAFTFQPSTSFSSESVGFTLTDGDGDTASSTLQLTGTTLPAGIAGSPINLGLTDPAGHVGPVTVTIAGIPAGWTLSGGTDNGYGVWTVQADNASTLSITSPDDYAGAMAFKVTMSWTNPDQSAGHIGITDNVEVFPQGAPIFAWSGDDHLTGSGAADLFVFARPIGLDTIYSFDAGQDRIDLIGYACFANFNDVQRHLSEDNAGNAVLALAAGQSITLMGVAAAALTAGNFVFDHTPVLNNPATMTISDGALLPLSGIIDNAGTIALDAAARDTHLQLIQNGLTLQGGGELILSDSAHNFMSGSLPGVTLTNLDNTISGAGQLGAGQMTLVNDGTIVATGFHALVIDTGANAVTNSGTLAATGSGGLIVNSDVANSGLIWAHGGNVTINGAVTGSGHAMISGAGTLGFGAASSADVTFAADAAGRLTLEHAAYFTGTISGFSSDDQIDLANISYATASLYDVTYNASTDLTTLVITDGTSPNTLQFVGNYTVHTAWHFSSDSNGGTLLTDSPLDGGGSAAPSAELAMATALATPDASADQFTFEDDSQSGTPADGSTLIASTDPSAADASDTTQSSPDGTTATTLADANAATNTQPATADATQPDATPQTASAPAAGLAAADTFVFAANFGNVTLANFDPGTDVIEIDHTVFADFQELLAAAHDDGSGNAVIAADSHDTITLKNVTVAQLVQHQGDFHFT
jgi:T1SS-143 domain-containing protein